MICENTILRYFMIGPIEKFVFVNVLFFSGNIWMSEREKKIEENRKKKYCQKLKGLEKVFLDFYQLNDP